MDGIVIDWVFWAIVAAVSVLLAGLVVWRMHEESQRIVPPDCPRCGNKMRRTGTIPNLYGADGPTRLYRCDACKEATEIRGK